MTRLSSTGNLKEKKQNSVEFTVTDSNNDATNVSQMDKNLPSKRTSIFTVEKLNERYNLNQDFNESPISGTWNYIKKYYKPTPDFFKRQLFKRIPFLEWIQHYNIKEWLVSDIVSGITIGIVHIPQGKEKF